MRERHVGADKWSSAPLREMEVSIAIPVLESLRVTIACCFINFPVTNRYRQTASDHQLKA